MAERGVIFDRATANKIVDATKRVLNTPVNLRGKSLPYRDSAVGVVRVKVVSAASGGGKYNGRILTSNETAVAATGTLAETDLGDVPTSNDCLVLNAAEVGKSTHDLTTGTPVAKVFIGFKLAVPSTASPPLPVIVINGIDWENCT